MSLDMNDAHRIYANAVMLAEAHKALKTGKKISFPCRVRCKLCGNNLSR